MEPTIGFEWYLHALAARGVVDAERDRERVWRLYCAMHLSTAEVVANAIEGRLLQSERERSDA